jgi:hypothetical protein
VGARTDFEIRPVPGGYAVFIVSTYWTRPNQVRITRGLINLQPFSSLEAATSWLAEQYSLSPVAWTQAADQSLQQGKGDSLPISKPDD